MTRDDFVVRCQGYFGAWPEGQRAAIVSYLKRYSDDGLDFMYAELVSNHKAHFGPPCVATMREFEARVCDRLKYSTKPDTLQIEDTSEQWTDEAREEAAKALDTLANLARAKKFRGKE